MCGKVFAAPLTNHDLIVASCPESWDGVGTEWGQSRDAKSTVNLPRKVTFDYKKAAKVTKTPLEEHV